MPISQPQRREGERGHLLVGLVVLLACMMIMLTAAAQSWTFLVRRDREAEMIHRGEEYAKAIAFYQKEVGAYPLKLDLLAEKGPHGHRFIRKLYEDPLADDGKWGLLYLSPTGQGFINPFATQIGEGFGPDPFGGIGGIGVGGAGGAFGQGGGGAFGQGGGGFGSSRKSGIGGRRSGKNKEQKPGYSELDQQTFQNFELSNMPIVGVVHKKQEWGLKIYKGQSSLNDWAFTILDEGEQTSIGGGKRQAPPPRGRGPSRGVGDAHNPIFLPGMLPPKPRGPNSTDQQRQDLQKWQEEQEEKRRALEEALNYQEDEEGADEDPNGTGDEDPNGAGEGSGEDPEGDGGGEGEDEDPNGTDGEDDEDD